MYLLIVTGMSGAGKTNVLKRLEDNGFFCVDNLPCEMLPGFIQLCQRSTASIEKAAVVIDSRENLLGNDIGIATQTLEDQDVKYDVVFLDSRDEVLTRRFKETRRPHPMGRDVTTGIQRERELLSKLKYQAKYIIDTSDLTPIELQQKLEGIITFNVNESFLLTFESFGFKRGIPMEADCVFDVRFTKNPFYVPELKHLSGVDKPVFDFIMQDTDFRDFLDEMERLLLKLIPGYIAQGKRRLIIAFGCTGGRHRSVCAAQELYKRFIEKYKTVVIHRDTVIEQNDIQSR